MESSPVIAEAVSYLTKKVDSKTRDVKVLQPTIATQTARTTEANSLYEMDKATQVMTVILVDIWYFNYGFLFSQHTFWADLQEVINAIVEAQSCGLGLPVNKISLGPDLPTICLQRSVGLPELRSLRRTFIKLAGQYSLSGPPPPADADSATRMFVDYLNREISSWYQFLMDWPYVSPLCLVRQRHWNLKLFIEPNGLFSPLIFCIIIQKHHDTPTHLLLNYVTITTRKLHNFDAVDFLG
jgi:hypothetical protein